jgi:hypothetical protein
MANVEPARKNGRHLWLWLLLGAVLLAMAPAALWMKKEIQRARLLRDHPMTDSVAPPVPSGPVPSNTVSQP